MVQSDSRHENWPSPQPYCDAADLAGGRLGAVDGVRGSQGGGGRSGGLGLALRLGCGGRSGGGCRFFGGLLRLRGVEVLAQFGDALRDPLGHAGRVGGKAGHQEHGHDVELRQSLGRLLERGGVDRRVGDAEVETRRGDVGGQRGGLGQRDARGEQRALRVDTDVAEGLGGGLGCGGRGDGRRGQRCGGRQSRGGQGQAGGDHDAESGAGGDRGNEEAAAAGSRV